MLQLATGLGESVQYECCLYMRKDKAFLRLLSNPRVIALHYSPSISRSIPVPVAIAWPGLLNEWLVVGFVSGILLFLVVTLGLKVQAQAGELTKKQQMHDSISAEISHWQQITKQYPQYRDGYFRLALLQYELGNEQLAGISLEKTLTIDPNFAPARAFQEKLEKE
jgi:hypothetical protein